MNVVMYIIGFILFGAYCCFMAWSISYGNKNKKRQIIMPIYLTPQIWMAWGTLVDFQKIWKIKIKVNTAHAHNLFGHINV